MLVPAMNNNEVTAAILKDLEKVLKTVDRLIDEYDRDRRKLKIDKSATYPRDYTIKTTSKNPWIIFIQKSPSVSRYKEVYHAVGCAVVYYYSKQGLKAFRYNSAGKYMEVFYGHFFTRYNERMNLNLPNPPSIMKKFFSTSGYLQPKKIKKGGKEYTMAVCKEGMALGEFYTNPDWLVHKTFISHDLKRHDQEESERRMMAMVEMEVLMQSVLTENFSDKYRLQSDKYRLQNDTLLHISQRC